MSINIIAAIAWPPSLISQLFSPRRFKAAPFFSLVVFVWIQYTYMHMNKTNRIVYRIGACTCRCHHLKYLVLEVSVESGIGTTLIIISTQKCVHRNKSLPPETLNAIRTRRGPVMQSLQCTREYGGINNSLQVSELSSCKHLS